MRCLTLPILALGPLLSTLLPAQTNWTQRASTGPLARAGHAMAYDSGRGRVVLFGGSPNGSTSLFADTWEWDGTNWNQRNPATPPSARNAHDMAYDSARGRVVLFGGSDYGAAGISNPRADTWEYAPVNPATYTPFGTGCPGSAGTPALASDQGSLPWVGDTFTARLTNLGIATVPFLFLGASNTFWGVVPLPFDLTLIGMSSCMLYTDPLLTFFLANNGGSATFSVPIPNDPSLVGLSLYNQGGVTSFGTNPLGLVMSNGCEMRFGGR